MEIGEVLQFVNLAMASSAMVMYIVLSRRYTTPVRGIYLMLAFNCFVMVVLYVLLIADVSLPALTGRLNLTLILTSLNMSAVIMLERGRR